MYDNVFVVVERSVVEPTARRVVFVSVVNSITTFHLLVLLCASCGCEVITDKALSDPV